MGILTCCIGCAGSVDKAEVEQKANPVSELHQDAQKAQDAEKNSVKWYSLDEALVKAHKEGKFIMVDFYAEWCKWCKKLDSETYKDPRVVEMLNADFVTVKIDAESSKTVVYEMRQMSKSELANKFDVSSYPAVWFLDSSGGKAKLLKGYLPPQDFVTYLRYIKSGNYKTTEFEDFATKGEKQK
ncbi:MAG: thioredoxin fold domain-containing protein [Nitrospirota bacterium]